MHSPRIFLAVTVFSVFAVGFSQQGIDSVYAQELKGWMLRNDVSAFEANRGLEKDLLQLDELAQEMGLASAFDLEILGVWWVECISPSVQFFGTAENLLDDEYLVTIMELRLRNDLSAVPICEEDQFEGRLDLDLLVWTVGDEYPVAAYEEYSTYVWDAPDLHRNPWGVEWLGTQDPQRLQRSIENDIEESIRDFALEFFKVR